MTSFTVVIPAYKASNYIPRLVESMKRASATTPFDVVFVDDGGNDGIDWESIRFKLFECDKILDVVLLRNTKNRGVTYSRNRGYLLSKSEYIIFMDSDDLFIPNSIDSIAQALRDSRDVDIALFSTQYSSRSQCQSDNPSCLIDDYGRGERLVVVKKNINALPFCGPLRGHEFYGLLRFLLNTGGKVKTFSTIVREYTTDNENSLSRPRNMASRHRLIAFGHIKSAFLLFNNGFFFAGFKFLIKGFISFSRGGFKWSL